MTTRHPRGTDPAPATDNPGLSPDPDAVPHAVPTTEHPDGTTAATPTLRPAGRRPLNTDPTTAG
ncbi:hypothetical protein CP967_00005 [Streptomyces nitrosporeus]|uniref:Uncharacterized protein n=1 Tax=Streptomyces nitrosporeus TaxID=28894 RepID=A0A5J6F338_9ACTN|nr:hypothetical protein [Streptomyces nitrosporeus]QEU70562.1 hypothetical protein CP967_00005 [Streptomyces nitrosporeus]